MRSVPPNPVATERSCTTCLESRYGQVFLFGFTTASALGCRSARRSGPSEGSGSVDYRTFCLLPYISAKLSGQCILDEIGEEHRAGAGTVQVGVIHGQLKTYTPWRDHKNPQQRPHLVDAEPVRVR
jgi:hypothetical protein